MPDDDLLTKIREAKGYIDKAISVLGYITDHKRDEYFMEALQAVEDTATDLSYEAWLIRQQIKAAQGEYSFVQDPHEMIPSLTGTRKIPEVKQDG